MADWLTTTDDPAKVAGFFADLTAATFEQENTRRQEDRNPTALTMSGLGGCTRRNAYAIAGTPPSDTHGGEEARQALLGVGAHDWFLPAMARTLGINADVEQAVTLHAAGITIRGSLDLALPGVVLDLKTVREWRLGGVRRNGAYTEHHEQVFGYALARYQAGYDVRWVVFLYMDRTSGDVEVVVERFTNAAAAAVIRRVETIKKYADTDPDAAPREARGPGVSLTCDRCPWLRRCWGPNAQPGQPGAQVTAAGDWEGLQQILALYAGAAEIAGAANADKDFAKLVLTETKPGTYGRYELRRGKPGRMDDDEAMRNILTAQGIDIPKKPRAGATRVVPAPTPKENKK